VSSNAELLAKDTKYVIRAWSSIAEPTPIARGQGALLYDYDGKSYIDCSSGMFCMNIGHSHPRVIEAVKAQVEKVMQVSGHQTTKVAVEYAELICSISPGDLKKLYFTTAGTETMNVAIKTAKAASGKWEFIALRNAYHGLHGAALAATGSTSYKKGFGPLEHGVLHSPHAYCYRCPFGMTYPSCELRCAQEIENIILNQGISTVSEGSIGTVVVEAVQGRGGIVPPEGWLKRVREICDKHGLLLVVDEIMSGFGRTGRLWAVEHESVVPDIMAISKGFGGGIPAGAVLTSQAVADKLDTAAAPTFGGNAMACAAGKASTEVLLEEKLWENAAAMGRRLVDGLRNMLHKRYAGDVRFKGLMGGLELVKDRETKEPLGKQEMARIKEVLLSKGIMVTYSGPRGNVFRIQPVLSITEEQIDSVISVFDEAIGQVVEG
jgi:4-aminobutyrate aminotransferase-like enzyme